VSIKGKNAQSRQLLETKWPEDGFFSHQSRQHTENKAAYQKL
jgi:hypothetical protein